MKMSFDDIKLQKAKVRGVEVTVESVGEPQETPWGEFCQTINIVGTDTVINCFSKSPEFGVLPTEVGLQHWDIKWDAKKQGFRGTPSEPQPTVEQQPDWAKAKYIENLGKCRMHILRAEIQFKGIEMISNRDLEEINKKAHFSMTGEIE